MNDHDMLKENSLAWELAVAIRRVAVIRLAAAVPETESCLPKAAILVGMGTEMEILAWTAALVMETVPKMEADLSLEQIRCRRLRL